MYSAENEKKLSFRLLDRRDLAPVRYRRVNEKTGKEVPWNEIVKGYEHEKNEYVVLSDAISSAPMSRQPKLLPSPSLSTPRKSARFISINLIILRR